MMKLKDLWLKGKKEELYDFYKKIVKDSKDYKSVTKIKMYDEILQSYYNDPEIILHLCTIEEISILKSLISEEVISKDNGYIEYLLFQDLKNNYLVVEEDNYVIPDDLINYVKMAINLYQEKEYSWSDIMDSVIIGLSRIYNVLSIEELRGLLSKYNMKFDFKSLKSYILNNIKFKNILDVKKYKNEYYMISLENLYYKDVLATRVGGIIPSHYLLEEIISIGKYRINLFNEIVFKFLNFLEMHFDKKSIHDILNDIIVYAGFQINDDTVLKSMAGNIEVLFLEMQKVVEYFPSWIATNLPN